MQISTATDNNHTKPTMYVIVTLLIVSIMALPVPTHSSPLNANDTKHNYNPPHHNHNHHLHHHHNHHHPHHHSHYYSHYQELHLGAKIALFVLMAAILLVACATFVDLMSDVSSEGANGSISNSSISSAQLERRNLGGSSNHLLHNNHQSSQQHMLAQQQHLQARNQRSPSLSSSCSSTLFNSASAPILQVDYRRRHQNHHNQATFDGCGQRKGGQQQQQQQPQQVSGKRYSLARQMLLACSLRHSAALIFELSPAHGDAGHQKRPPTDDEQPEQCCTAPQRLANTGRSESIDCLHGLRFLSMIWIIVIHSYSFAFRWLLFTNSSTLENIYKTAASQLLANGTFACDSFFFAGGFLLPYLAFPGASAAARNAKQAAARLCCAVAARSPRAAALAACTTTLREAEAARQQQQQQRQQCDQDNSKRSQARSGSPERASQTANAESDSLSSSSGSLDSRQSAATTRTCPSCSHLAAPHHNHNHNHHNHNHQPLNQQHNWQDQHEQQQLEQEHKQSNAAFSHRLHLHTDEPFGLTTVISNILHRYVRMAPLMMAIIGLSATLLRYMGEGPAWDNSTMMFDKWCRHNWWINALFLHNFVKTENMCLSHSWYSAVDMQLFLLGQLMLFILFRSKLWGILLCCTLLVCAQLANGALTLIYHLPAVPLIASVSEQSMNLYYGQIYIKPYCRASPYLIGILLAYLMRTTSLSQIRLNKWQVTLGWTLSIGTFVAILMAMQPAMNGQVPSELQSALYSSLSRPLWACATGWMIFACMTQHGGLFATILSARCFVPLSRLTYPAYLINPIVMAVFYGSRQSTFQFTHYLMIYLILGNIVITYAIAFLLSALFELPLLSIERTIKRAWCSS